MEPDPMDRSDYRSRIASIQHTDVLYDTVNIKCDIRDH
jgi:hypothetical protein